MHKAYLNWSSGKDSAFALYKVQKEGTYRVEKLVTTLNSEEDRISMHGVRKSLLLEQAESLGIPLHIIPLKGNVVLKEYEKVMRNNIELLKAEGFTHSIFGDIYLEDLRIYREKQLQKEGIKVVFPLWQINSSNLIREIIEAGFKAITVSVNAKMLDKTFCGRLINDEFLKDLPANVDPCGENGEFHTFVYDGPNFKFPVNFEIGEISGKNYSSGEKKEERNVKKEAWDSEFWYCDLIPV